MLTNLRLRNFKSWRDTGEIDLAPITGVFGANSSGKTSLIQALLLLKQTATSSDRNLTFHFGDDTTLTNLGDFGSVVYQRDLSEQIDIELGWDRDRSMQIRNVLPPRNVIADSTQLQFRVSTDQAQPGDDTSVATAKMSYRIGEAEFGMRRQENNKKRYEIHSEGTSGDFRFQRTQGRPWPLPRPTRYYGFPDEARAYFQNAGFLADLVLDLEMNLGRIYYLGPLRAYPERVYTWTGERPTDVGRAGDQAVAAILSAARAGDKISRGRGRKRHSLEQHVAYWLKSLDLIYDFRVDQIAEHSPLYQVKVRKTKNAAETLITDVGFGVSQILPVLVLCFYVPENSTVILEQPEIHLHPAVQSGLADVLIDANRLRGVQFLVESHSEHLLTRLQRRIAEEHISNEDIAIYFCEQDGECSVATRLIVDIFGNIANWPRDFFGDEFGEMAAMSEAGIKRRTTDAAG